MKNRFYDSASALLQQTTNIKSDADGGSSSVPSLEWDAMSVCWQCAHSPVRSGTYLSPIVRVHACPYALQSNPPSLDLHHRCARRQKYAINERGPVPADGEYGHRETVGDDRQIVGRRQYLDPERRQHSVKYFLEGGRWLIEDENLVLLDNPCE